MVCPGVTRTFRTLESFHEDLGKEPLTWVKTKTDCVIRLSRQTTVTVRQCLRTPAITLMCPSSMLSDTVYLEERTGSQKKSLVKKSVKLATRVSYTKQVRKSSRQTRLNQWIADKKRKMGNSRNAGNTLKIDFDLGHICPTCCPTVEYTLFIHHSWFTDFNMPMLSYFEEKSAWTYDGGKNTSNSTSRYRHTGPCSRTGRPCTRCGMRRAKTRESCEVVLRFRCSKKKREKHSQLTGCIAVHFPIFAPNDDFL